jgi:DNA-binding transcriptional LysR family regulator
MIMELRLLNYFVAVYEEKSITRASQRCNISQPSLSNAIIQLEDMLHTTLFNRHKKGVDLTDHAHHLYPSAKKLIKDALKLSDMFIEAPAPMLLRLGMFPDLSPTYLKKIFSDIDRKVPRLQLELVDHDAASDGRLTLDIFKREDELFFPLWEEDYMVCMPAGHPLTKETEITPAMLHAHPFIECPPCEAHQQTMGILSGAGMYLNISCRAEHKGQVLHLIQAGMGISFLPTGVAEYGNDCVIKPFDGPRMFRRIGLCYPSNLNENDAMQYLIEAIS